MSELNEKLLEIKRQKDTYIIPENLKKDVTVFGVTGTYEGSGGTVSVEEKDVNFYDYNGTRLYSYTLAEIQTLTELPDLPSHSGLIYQGWNWTLADIKNENKETDVGAMYITDDGKTRLYIKIETKNTMNVPLCFRQSVANGVEVDWGDGSAVETFSGSGSENILPTHTYSSVSNYVITLKPVGNCQLTLGSTTFPYGIMGSNKEANRIYQNMLYKAEIGNSVTSIGNYAFYSCYNLSSITIPNSVTGIGSYVFSNCYNLSSITIPNSVTGIGNNVFSNCYNLSSITIPNSVTGIGNNVFSNCYNLSSITIPNSVTSIGIYAFSNDMCLFSITLPNSVTSIGNYAFYSCCNLSSIIMPNSVTSIGNYTFFSDMCLFSITLPNSVTSIGDSLFSSCCGVGFYDFSAHTSIPTLSNTNAFSGIATDCKIIVPDSLYETWKSATNWSTYASYIIKKTDWDAL